MVLPLAQRLSVYDDSAAAAKRLSDVPPALEPIACKPLFFDLALSDVQFPDLTERLQVHSVF